MSFTPTPVHRTFLRSNAESLWVTLAGTLMLWTWVMWVGRDLSWDVINHHIYLPFSLLSGRHAADLFAAGPQSYQNPIGYLPFYGLLRSDAPSWLVGTVLVMLHALVRQPKAIEWDELAEEAAAAARAKGGTADGEGAVTH